MRSPRYCWSFLARTPDSTADVFSQLIQDVSATADMRENYTFTTNFLAARI